MPSRKLKLDPENLQVTSFDAQPAPAQARGTVKGHNPVPSPTDLGATCSACSWDGILCCTQPRGCGE